MAENCVVFSKYDKISDDLIYLGKGTLVKFNVALAYRDKNGCRKSYHSEYQYSSKKYNNVSSDLRSIKRNFDYYLSIDVQGNFDASIMIRPKDMLIFQNAVKIISKWLLSGKVFGCDKQGNVHIIKDVGKYYIKNLCGKYIAFAPAVIRYDNKPEQEGIRIFLNSDNVFVDVNIDTFMELTYLVQSMDMYQCAIGLINYLGRPEFGYNITGIDEYGDRNPYLEQDINEDSGATIRKSITADSKKKDEPKCAFDGIDALAD